MRRRRFLFWIGFGLFSLSEKLRISALDELAAATMESGEGDTKTAVHWRANSNGTWQWYEREVLVEGRWMVTGITTPIHKDTGEPYREMQGYLDAGVVPAEFRVWDLDEDDRAAEGKTIEPKNRQPLAARRARHGRPPSKWLRSLQADELRTWLKTLDVPEAGVAGMTYFEHLTRDHFFHAERIKDLTIPEQALLHAAAHHGY